MFEREVEELIANHRELIYARLDSEIVHRAETRKESELSFSFGLLLSGFGGGVSTRKYLTRKVAENA